MYKVFLADDEIVVREGIRSGFPWDDTDFVLSGEAPDGEIALSMLQDIKPDILITDIRMPFMDGLELCRAVTRSMPWIYVVILSGYDDFAYAREAISLGVKEYLLKPVSGQELLAVLSRIADRIQEEKRQQANLMAMRAQFASSSRYLKEKLLMDLMSGANYDELVERARALQVNLLANDYLVMAIRPAQEAEDRDALMRARGVLQRLADGSGGTVQVCETAPGDYALLVLGDNEEDLEERAYGLAQSAQYDVERNTGLKLLVGIGAAVGKLREVKRSFDDAQKVLMRLREGAQENGHLRILGAQDMLAESGLTLMDLNVTPIQEQIKHATIQDVDAILSHYAESLGQSAQQSYMMANYVFVDIMLAASRIIKENGGAPQEVLPASVRDTNMENLLLPLDEVLPLAREILLSAIEFRDSQGSARYGSVIRKAKAYIAEEYMNPNLTLHDVARHVALSNNHFCTVFSQEMGLTFTEYLTSVRLDRARELLRESALRTSDVAYKVGYNDPHYFSYLFKKNVGLSPRDYKRKG